MRTRTWLPLLSISSSLALAACSDDVGVTPTTTEGSSTTGSDSTTDGVEPTGGLDDTTAGPFVGCGDGLVDPAEACDDGNADDGDGCSMMCELEEGFLCQGQPTVCFAVCGDGMEVGDEECDDDAVLDGDGCSAECVVEPGYACEGTPSTCAPVCGDGMVIAPEACDDMDLANGDGCSAACAIEEGFMCAGAPSACTGICGDDQILGDEACDDGNTAEGDGCSDVCAVEKGWACGMEPSVCMTGCGDGIAAGMEQCDDMGLEDGDGCSAACTLESGWTCTGNPSVCSTECGDGAIAGDEICDDGNVAADDGCSELCTLEPGFECAGEPSACVGFCGDGVQVAGETCDDGNFDSGDGCSLACQAEFGWDCVGVPSVCSLDAVLDRVSLGIDGGCVLTTAGDVGCFGANTQGEVGIGFEDVNVHLPTFTLDDVIALASGQQHHCAVRAGGAAWCWGDNLESQMGPMSTPPTDEHLPIEVTGTPPLVDIAAGDDHTCGLTGMGEVWCWGDNFHLQLGRGGMDTTDDPNPAAVPMPGGLAAVSLGLGDDHSCAVLSDTTVACWGDDDNGQQGNGPVATDNSDAVLVTGLSGVVQVEGGDDHTCALDGVGAVWCWGDNDNGQLGQGDVLDEDVPQPVVLPAAAVDVTLGDNFTCALLVDDTVYCWGEAADFQLASGDLLDVLTPNPVPGLPPGALVDVEAGSRGVCVVTAAAERYCWGYSQTGLLGIAPLDQLDPRPVDYSMPPVAVELSQAEFWGVQCGVMADGTVECTGDGTTVAVSTFSGAEGLFEPITYHLVTPTPMALLSDVQQLGLGDGFACVATSTDVQCWGDNSNLQLGQGGISTVDILTPVPVTGLGVVDQLGVGSQFACVRIGGAVQCWGDNQNLQTGEGATVVDQSLPVSVVGLDDAVDLQLGEDHACALRMGGVVSCWGDDGFGQLGDGDADPIDSAVPVPVMGLPPGVEQLSLGQDHACAVAAGEVYCWGGGVYGQLGQGNEMNADMALLVPGLSGVVQVEAGRFYTCAIDGMGGLTCWGQSSHGQLGDGGVDRTGLTERLDPIPVAGVGGVTDVVAGEAITCFESAGQWSCMGFRSSGQMGNGTSLEPVFPLATLFGL